MTHKVFSGPRDLAIHGAAPAFDRPLHVGQPTMGDRMTFERYIDQMFESRWFTNNGPLVQEFERRIAERLGVQHCVAMSNGTTALEIAIRAVGMTGEVIVPSYTFIATAHALHWQGITPVFADIDPVTHNLDPDSVRRMITSRTTGIIGVHLWGRPAPVDDLQKIATEHGLELLFDAAHAFDCSRDGRMIGANGRAEVFSFHATKFFNSFEGGAVLTDDDDLARDMRLMRNFGFAEEDSVILPGTNAKMSEPCAAMGLTNLDHLPTVVAANRRNYDAYRDVIGQLPGLSILEYDETEQNSFQYVVVEVGPECPVTREVIHAGLRAENVLARRYFWPGCHRMKPYRDLFPNAGVLLPSTEKVADRVLVLPTGMAVSTAAIAVIADALTWIVRSDVD